MYTPTVCPDVALVGQYDITLCPLDVDNLQLVMAAVGEVGAQFRVDPDLVGAYLITIRKQAIRLVVRPLFLSQNHRRSQI